MKKGKRKSSSISNLFLSFTLLLTAMFTILFVIAVVVYVRELPGGVTSPVGRIPRYSPVLMIFVVCTAIVVGILMYIWNRVFKPISNLNEALIKVGKGDFNCKLISDNEIEEIEEMYTNFNSMVHELNSTETLRSDFIANVSHEFKTPLSSIEGYVTLLQTENLEQKKRDEYLEKVIINTRRLSDLTGNILKLSKLENQQALTEKSPVDLAENIRQQILLLEEKWTKKNIEFDIDLEEIFVLGKDELLSVVWYNLISNAIKFSHENGRVTIKSELVDDYVRINITDEGIGMAEEEMIRIFDKFYQGDSSHKTEGNGLGLALAKKIIVLHGGNIYVSSQKGEGTTFTVTLNTTKNA